MAELHSCYPSSPSNKRNHVKRGRIEYKGKGTKSKGARWLLFLRPLPAGFYSSVHFGRELPHNSSRQDVHHRLIPHPHGEQLRDLHLSASACSPPSLFSHLFRQHFLLVIPSVAVGEEMFPHLGTSPASAAEPPVFIVGLASQPF